MRIIIPNINRTKSFLYSKLLRNNIVKLKDEELSAAKIMQDEMFLTIDKGNAHLNAFCESNTYEEQKIRNERRYKTIVSASIFKPDGNKQIMKRLFLPFHQNIVHSKQKFLEIYPEFHESDTILLKIEYTDSLLRKVETVYETQGY